MPPPQTYISNVQGQVRLLRAREVFHYPNGIALMLPYYELGHLGSVSANTKFDLAKKRDATRQILDGLRVLHKLLRIHRDIKPNNILVQSLEPLNLVIGDFGQVSVSHPVSITGTDIFRAPEILHYFPTQRHHTTAVDIYSMGMLILWLLGPDVVGDDIIPAELYTRKAYNEAVGSKITAAIARHPSGELRFALQMAQTMAQWNPDKRPSASACLQLRWINPVVPARVGGIATQSPSRRRPLSQQTGNLSIRRSPRLNNKTARYDPIRADNRQRPSPMQLDSP